MDGVHDLGGRDGFGPVPAHGADSAFAAEWEGRVLAMMRALIHARAFGLDHMRHAVERLPPQLYLSASYYERWLAALETLAVERGLAEPDELRSGHAISPAPPRPGRLTAEVATTRLARGSSFGVREDGPRFAAGERVRTRNLHPRTHIRLPGYARSKVGTIERCHGIHRFPDAVAADRGDDPQWLYTVVFTGAELFGSDAESGSTISVEAFEPYLEPAT